jgi:hypothetical protein
MMISLNHIVQPVKNMFPLTSQRLAWYCDRLVTSVTTDLAGIE